jgi:hypothetical protein
MGCAGAAAAEMYFGCCFVRPAALDTTMAAARTMIVPR